MTRALQGELLKLRTTRTFFAFVVSAVGLSLLIVILFTALADFDEEDVRSTFTADFASLFITLLGAIGMAGEWRHRTIANTVLSVPHRLRLLGAKLIAYAIGGALLSLFVNIAIMIAGTLILSSRGIDTLSFGDLLDVLWRNLAIAAFLGPIGVCVGTLIRNPAVAIVVILAWGFVLENTLTAVATDVEKFMPTQGAPSGVQQVDIGFEPLSTGVALLVMAGWVALLGAAAIATFTKRDLV
jgi:ABC-2 type transport system permease protein